MAMINYVDKVAINANAGIPDANKVKDTDMNELKNAFNNQVAKGWYNSGTSSVYAYVSWNATTKIGVVSSSVDPTSYLSVGMKVKFTQNAIVKYGIIVAISSTQITLFMGTDYTLLNSVITNAFYSILKAPYGFPMDQNKWKLTVGITSNYYNATPTTTDYYGSSVLALSLPIGAWDLSYQVGVQITATATQYCSANISTSPTSLVGNAGFTDNQSVPVAGVIAKRFRASNKIILTAPATYYFMFKNDTAYTALYITGSATSISSIDAICSYL